MTILIKGGHVINPATQMDEVADVLIEDQKIKKIGKELPEKEAERVINADGCYVMPGFIDMHVHFRDPGFEQKEDIYTGMQAAAHGGYTTVLTMPNTKPVADNPDIDLVAGLTGEMLGEIFAWKQDEWYDELKTLGFYLGKFIYLMDAYEDRDKDEKKDSYNPLRYLDTEDEQEYETLCRLMMTSMISECAKSFERLPILLHADILRNILYSGVWSKYEYIQLKKKRKKS